MKVVESTQCQRRWTVRLPRSPTCSRRRTDNWVTTVLLCWRHATIPLRAVVSYPSPTPRSADATSRLIAPSAISPTPGRRQRRQTCAVTLATLLAYAAYFWLLTCLYFVCFVIIIILHIKHVFVIIISRLSQQLGAQEIFITNTCLNKLMAGVYRVWSSR